MFGCYVNGDVVEFEVLEVALGEVCEVVFGAARAMCVGEICFCLSCCLSNGCVYFGICCVGEGVGESAGIGEVVGIVWSGLV